jgi:hypothetical protein
MDIPGETGWVPACVTRASRHEKVLINGNMRERTVNGERASGEGRTSRERRSLVFALIPFVLDARDCAKARESRYKRKSHYIASDRSPQLDCFTVVRSYAGETDAFRSPGSLFSFALEFTDRLV